MPEQAPEPISVPKHRERSSHVRCDVLDQDSLALFETLCASTGLSARPYRPAVLLRRRAACLRALRVRTLQQAAAAIRSSPAAAQQALSAVLIGVTGFFRDASVFEALNQLLPQLTAGDRPVDVCSVACADGAELYSAAMLVAAGGALHRSRFWGLDCRAQAISAASAGVYDAAAVEAVPADLRQRFLQRVAPALAQADGAAFAIVDSLRERCCWTVGNVLALPPDFPTPPQVDLLLCRNLAIYLQPSAAAEMWKTLAARLRPGGLLVVGKAERPHDPQGEQFDRLVPCIYRKRAEAA